MLEQKEQFNNPESKIPEKESLREREIKLEDLTNKDILRAMIIWYEKGNTMLNLAERWGKKIQKFYQKNIEEFIEKYWDKNITANKIKDGLLNFDSKYRIGFKTEGVENYGYLDAKFRIVYDEEDKERNSSKKKIQFLVDTNDIDNGKENRQANYLLAKNTTEEWEKAGLPVYENFGSLSEEKKQEILEIEKNPEKLKKFWENLSQRKYFLKEELEKIEEQKQESKREFELE